MHKCKERELRDNGSNANTKICFEVRAPSSTSPPSPRRISNPLICPPRTPTGGTSTEEDLYNKGVPNSSLKQHYLHRGNTTTIHLYRRGIRPVAKTTKLHLSLEGANTTPINLYQRGIQQIQGGYNTWRFPQPQTISFPQNKRSQIDRIGDIAQV